MSVGKSIRYYREQKDVSQQWLANAIGVSKMTVSNFESDKKYPNVKMVKKICEALGITLGKLMSYKEDIEIAKTVFHNNKLTKAEKNAILSQVRLNVQMYHDACMCANAEVDENRLPKEKIPMGTDLEEIAAYIREACTYLQVDRWVILFRLLREVACLSPSSNEMQLRRAFQASPR